MYIGKKRQNKPKQVDALDEYEFSSGKIKIIVTVRRAPNEYVPIYEASISEISSATEIVLDKIREELIKGISFSSIDLVESKDSNVIEANFSKNAVGLITKYFPGLSEEETEFLRSYLLQKSLGFGNLHIPLNDPFVEEIVVNSSDEPAWLYHKTYGWLKSNIIINDEQEIKRYATMIGRKIGRQISVLEPMLDAHMAGGNRVNATFSPISINGNTMTFRKFSQKPLTITNFISTGTLKISAAAMLWHAIQYEMSILISGGTASGKTSMLNVLANFFPPNQRILSIEDTREIKLPKYLHWVPLMTRLPNAEGKGEVGMGDLLVNSLRMRPDRIIVGEVRRKREIETLFEAIHTGHSCYATIHANDAHETLNRLLNPPFDVPKTMLPAVSLIVNQFRNRRTGVRRTFQIAEINKDSSITVLKQYDTRNDVLKDVAKSKTLINSFRLYSGQSPSEIASELKEKEKVLNYLVKNKIDTVDGVGKIIAEYYMDKKNLMTFVRNNKKFEGV